MRQSTIPQHVIEAAEKEVAKALENGHGIKGRVLSIVEAADPRYSNQTAIRISCRCGATSYACEVRTFNLIEGSLVPSVQFGIIPDATNGEAARLSEACPRSSGSDNAEAPSFGNV